MTMIDLRSDTVTTPTDEMREAMKSAPVGDDVFEEDPTVMKLEKRSAEIMGKEKGLFVSSGTMGNLVAILTHCGRGDELLVARGAHIFQYEQGTASTLGGITMNPIGTSKMEHLKASDVKQNIAPDDVHKPRTKLVSLENTLNGIPQPVDEVDEIGSIARSNKLVTHMDGARIFNAAQALGVEPGRIVKNIDTVQFCFSKGLSAPVGSMLCGSKSFISEARRWRKALGGGMRQVGVLANPCLISLEKMSKRLEEDHQTAKLLAEGLKKIDLIKCDLNLCQTNMVWIEPNIAGCDAFDLASRLKEKQVLVIAVSDKMIRAVTHYGITDSDIKKALSAIEESVKELAGSQSVISGK